MGLLYQQRLYRQMIDKVSSRATLRVIPTDAEVTIARAVCRLPDDRPGVWEPQMADLGCCRQRSTNSFRSASPTHMTVSAPPQ